MRSDPQRAKALQLIELGSKLAERVDRCIEALGPDHQLERCLQSDAIETLIVLGPLAAEANPDVTNAVVRWEPPPPNCGARTKLRALAAIRRGTCPRPRRAWLVLLVPRILDDRDALDQLTAIDVALLHGRREARPAVYDVLRNATDLSVKVAAAEALAVWATRAELPGLLHALGDPSVRIVRPCLRGVLNTGMSTRKTVAEVPAVIERFPDEPGVVEHSIAIGRSSTGPASPKATRRSTNPMSAPRTKDADRHPSARATTRRLIVEAVFIASDALCILRRLIALAESVLMFMVFR
jgi:hypothetical protein